MQGKSRPLNRIDWIEDRSAQRRPSRGWQDETGADGDSTGTSFFAAKIVNDNLVIESTPKAVVIKGWQTLASVVAERLGRSDYLFALVDQNLEAVVVYGSRPEKSDSGIEYDIWAWVALTRHSDGWRTIATAGDIRLGRGPSPFVALSARYFAGLTDMPASDQPAAFAVSCNLAVFDHRTGRRIFQAEAAFSNEIDLHIDETAGTLLVKSEEWYGAASLELYDLRTGSMGPWMLTDVAVEEASRLGPGVRAPPWGDQLRQAMLGEADPALRSEAILLPGDF